MIKILWDQQGLCCLNGLVAYPVQFAEDKLPGLTVLRLMIACLRWTLRLWFTRKLHRGRTFVLFGREHLAMLCSSTGTPVSSIAVVFTTS